jgi:UDP-glucose 4-epimerase
MLVNGNGKHLSAELSSLNGARVLVTGGAGAIGNNVSRQLVRLGAEVVVIDDFSSSSLDNLADIADMIKIVEGDVASDDVLDIAFSSGLEYVFHLAALFANQNSVEHPREDLQTNGFGTLRLLQKAVEYGVRRFVFASSSCVYGRRGEVLDEGMVLAPDTPYGMTKVLGEQYAQFFARQNGLPVAILRYFNSYGPGEMPGLYRNVIPNFFARAVEGKALPITGTGEETRDFTFVEDIVRGTLLAATREQAQGEIFNLGTGCETRIDDLAEQINSIVGNSAGIERVSPRIWDHIAKRCARIDKAKEELLYNPIVELEEGLTRYWSWYAERCELVGVTHAEKSLL